MKSNKKSFFCRCGHNEHHLIIEPVDFDMVCFSINLSDNLSFFNRLILGIKYIFGYRARHGMFAEILLDPNDFNEMKEYLNQIEQNVHLS